ncbi:MAG TPA: lamin tail domain-containing protein [Verrucomicrobiales bacterium]|nr:lamin tail domain-containing protein [Verrucomicrobiales bacterium]
MKILPSFGLLLPAAIALLCQPAAAALKITEFLASNEDGLTDEDGDEEDWIEIQNQGPDAVNLANWRLTDNAARPDKWIFPSLNLASGARLLVWASEKDHRDPARELHTNFKLSSDGEYLGLIRPDGTVEHDFGTAYPAQFEDVSYGYGQASNDVTLVTSGTPGGAAGPSSGGTPGRWKVPADGTADVFLAGGALNPAPWIATGFNDSTWTAVTGGVGYDNNTSGVNYLPYLGSGGNCGSAMFNIRQSVYMRWSFNVTDPSTIARLVLRMRFEDGFVAYLNGSPILRAHWNDPVNAGWQSAATALNDDGAAIALRDFEIAGAGSALQVGANVLCIHGLNMGVGSSDVLFAPELVASVTFGPVTTGYFRSPTPGEANSASTPNPGPLVLEVPKNLPRPSLPATTIPITAKVLPTLNPVTGIRLKYQIMYGTEADVPMEDTGANGDVTAGDGIYTAVMNVSALTAGQMVRWRVVATDSAAVEGSAPLFLNPLDAPKYFGTVAQDSRLNTSQLPILHWFIQNPTGADNASGTRCSFYYQENSAAEGEFYDNILMNTHGQSTTGFAKKSYDIDFNHDYRFLYKNGERRVKDINLLTNWADKSKVRNTITWQIYTDTGSYGLFAYPVRVQRNAAFFSIADIVEDGDERYLERAGLNPQGALYKMYNTLDSATSGVEKKTRRSEANADLQAFITGLDAAKPILDRRRYAYDNLAIATTVNYLASHVLTNSQDQGHKNYYLYRDTGISNEWMPLPWDQDLSLGHTWTSAQNYFDDDVDSQRGLQNGATNRLKQFVYSAPEINRMFTRRLRTLADKYLISATSTTGLFETQIAALLDRIDPPGLGTSSDAWLDYQAWGHWTDGNGGAKINPTQTGWDQHGPRASAARILNSNNPAFYPTSAAYAPFVYNGVNPPTTAPFLPGRRSFLYSAAAVSGADRVPADAQVANPAIVISTAVANPGIGDQEYFVLRNNEPVHVDISGWKVTGAVDFTFPGGTVIPPYTTGAENVGLLFVARSASGFRSRAASPKGNELCFLMSGYHGQLSARGETIELRNEAGTIVNTLAIPAAPTPAQQSLRVTEILYKPTDPTPAERTAIPAVITEDFEFIELMNIGATPLDLSGAQFIEGVTFTFPASTILAPGARTLIVSNAAAFALRHPGVTNIAGQYSGQLDNNGETLDLIDAAGETILEFSYNDSWYPPTDLFGNSLVFLDPVNTPWNEWDKRTRWGLSATPGGTAGQPDTGTAMIYEVWANTAFTALDRDDPLVSDPTADPDGDGADNLLEYALNGQPKTQDAVLPAVQVYTDAGQSALAVTYRRRISTLDLTYEVQASGDLNTWDTLNTPVGAPVNHGDGTQTITIRDSVPFSVSRHRYIRLKVSRPY